MGEDQGLSVEGIHRSNGAHLMAQVHEDAKFGAVQIEGGVSQAIRCLNRRLKVGKGSGSVQVSLFGSQASRCSHRRLKVGKGSGLVQVSRFGSQPSRCSHRRLKVGKGSGSVHFVRFGSELNHVHARGQDWIHSGVGPVEAVGFCPWLHQLQLSCDHEFGISCRTHSHPTACICNMKRS